MKLRFQILVLVILLPTMGCTDTQRIASIDSDLDSSSEATRKDAMVRLKKMTRGSPNDEVSRLLLATLKNSNYDVRAEGARLLGVLKEPRAVEGLITAIRRGEDVEVRGEAARALGEIGDPRAVAGLIGAYEDGRPSSGYIMYNGAPLSTRSPKLPEGFPVSEASKAADIKRASYESARTTMGNYAATALGIICDQQVVEYYVRKEYREGYPPQSTFGALVEKCAGDEIKVELEKKKKRW